VKMGEAVNRVTRQAGFDRHQVGVAGIVGRLYAKTREECQEKLKVLIAEMKAEISELKTVKHAGSASL